MSLPSCGSPTSTTDVGDAGGGGKSADGDVGGGGRVRTRVTLLEVTGSSLWEIEWLVPGTESRKYVGVTPRPGGSGTRSLFRGCQPTRGNEFIVSSFIAINYLCVIIRSRFNGH